MEFTPENNPIHSSENKKSIDLGKLRKFGLAAVAGALLFLQSCEGNKERASSKDIENHIENPDFEKINPQYLQFVENYLNENGHQKLSGGHVDGDEGSDRTWDFTQTDSTILLDKFVYSKGLNTVSYAMDHVEVDKETGVVTLFVKKDLAALAPYDTTETMIINKEGEVIKTMLYKEGTGKNAFEATVVEIQNPQK